MTVQEISDFLNTDVEFSVNGRHYGICPFESVCYIGNGKESFAFDTVEEAIAAPVIEGKSVIELWDTIYPQVS